MQSRKERRARRGILTLREKQGRALKNLGIYLAVVLLIFAILVPLIGQKVQARRSEAAKVLHEAGENASADITVGVQKEVAESSVDQELSTDKITAASSNPVIAEKTPPQSQESTPAAKPVEPQPPAADISKVIFPLKGEIAKPYGMAYSATHGDYRFHNGIDLKAPLGTTVKAALDGKISQIVSTKSEATAVTIDHGGGLFSSYAHLEKSSVKKGQTVQKGQAIGTVGKPGLSEVLDETHLHFTLSREGESLDPLGYLPSE